MIALRRFTNIQHCGICVKYRPPDQPKHVPQANPDRYVSPPMDFLFQKSLLYTSIPLRRNVSARISLRRLIGVDTLRRVHHVGILAERLLLLLCLY